jgi:hypothetical protein
MTSTKQSDEAAQDALDRTHRAHGRGTGCCLTAEMIQSLALTAIGEIWSGERPTAPYPPRSTFERDFVGRTAKEARLGKYFAAPDRPQNARIDCPLPVFLLASVASISPRLCGAFHNVQLCGCGV